MVDKLSEAKANGYWLDKIASMSVLGSPATSVASRSPTSAGGVSKADLDQAMGRADRAEAAVAELAKRVEKLENELHAVEAVWTKH
ncbi:MAG: hypothetical protein ACRDZ3_11735 [Acidimicrobiia bacterium]